MWHLDHNHLVIFTRYPEAGRVKTRLIPALGAFAAARLHREMSLHCLRTARLLGSDVYMELYADEGEDSALRQLYGADINLRRQSGEDLGQRMLHAFHQAFTRGSGRVVLIGTDCPLITPDTLRNAFQQLDTHDCVLGPALDGGYYLIGLRRPEPVLFDGVPWGTHTVLADTLERARTAGLSTLLLDSLPDIDRPEDLPVWKTALCRAKPRIAAIIPALNEASVIVPTIDALRQDDTVDILVVDGGSSDNTVSIASARGVRVIQTQKGRARQLNIGARHTDADIFFFLHADTQVPPDYAQTIREALADARTIAGAFRLAFVKGGLGLGIMALGANARSHFLQLPYGDQGIFLWARDFHAAGGFPDMPIMDDAFFIKSLAKQGRIVTVKQHVSTSARRYQRLGLFPTWLINQCVLSAFTLGVDPHKIANLYRSQAGFGTWIGVLQKAVWETVKRQ